MMIEKLKEFLNCYKIKNQNVILAFSSGPDSCALALCLAKIQKEFNLKITLAYFNHGWRKEALLEENFTKEFADKYNFNFLIGKAPENSPKKEEHARNLRYAFLLDCAQKINTNAVFLAHNKNDNIETLVYRIIKGTSISGLKSIPKKREIFYRPFLDIEKKEILEFLKSNNQNYLIDSSNDDIKYKRNLIRKEILPCFEKINPNYLENINNLIQNSIFSKKIIDNEINKIEQKIITNSKINRREFLSLQKEYRLEILNNFLEKFLKYRTCKNLSMYDDFILKNENLKISLNKNKFLFSGREYIEIIENTKKNTDALLISGEGEYCFEDNIIKIQKTIKSDNIFPKADENVCYLNLIFPLHLRHRKNGDIFIPYSINASKIKLKDYLINKKIPQDKKDKLILLACKNEICWILGMQISEKFKVRDKNCYKLIWEKKING